MVARFVEASASTDSHRRRSTQGGARFPSRHLSPQTFRAPAISAKPRNLRAIDLGAFGRARVSAVGSVGAGQAARTLAVALKYMPMHWPQVSSM